MLPPIEFFMGMLAGGILGCFVAIMVNDWDEAGH
jgi:gas vesicle protein